MVNTDTEQSSGDREEVPRSHSRGRWPRPGKPLASGLVWTHVPVQSLPWFLNCSRSSVRLRGIGVCAQRNRGAQGKTGLSLPLRPSRPLPGVQRGHLLPVSPLSGSVWGQRRRPRPAPGCTTGLSDPLHQSQALQPPGDRRLELGTAEITEHVPLSPDSDNGHLYVSGSGRMRGHTNRGLSVLRRWRGESEHLLPLIPLPTPGQRTWPPSPERGPDSF